VQKRILTKAPQKFSVLGLPVHLLDDYSSWLIDRADQRLGTHVVTLNAEMTIQAEKNLALTEAIAKADLIVPDGSGVVLYLHSKGKPVERTPGIELAESLLRQAGIRGKSWSVFFYGGATNVAQKAALAWQNKHPGLAIAGTQNGFLKSKEEEQQLLNTLKDLQPRIIFVGLGVPRQELWIASHRHICPHSIWIGVGGSFDIWAGNKNRAPAWMGKCHLEWLYRLYQEPWRWRRMLALPLFVWKALISR
jgi:N-acetylglucosaminyldiphosphoundecaprenol N-acetyl-beta-D-mannosaminyltransferase